MEYKGGVRIWSAFALLERILLHFTALSQEEFALE